MIKLNREEKKATIETVGEDVVAASVPEIRARMREALDAGVSELVVDLANVQMVDSTGIGLLISAHNSLNRIGGRISVIHASPDILELFQTMRMHHHFSISGVQG